MSNARKRRKRSKIRAIAATIQRRRLEFIEACGGDPDTATLKVIDAILSDLSGGNKGWSPFDTEGLEGLPLELILLVNADRRRKRATASAKAVRTAISRGVRDNANVEIGRIAEAFIVEAFVTIGPIWMGGMWCKDIAIELNRRGIKSFMGKEWSESTVSRLVVRARELGLPIDMQGQSSTRTFDDELMSECLRLRQEGFRQHEIAQIFNERGLLTKRGARWHQGTISQYLRKHGVADRRVSENAPPREEVAIRVRRHRGRNYTYKKIAEVFNLEGYTNSYGGPWTVQSVGDVARGRGL